MDMKPEPQVFTLEEANALVPQLRDLVGKQLARRADIEDRLRSLAETTGEMPTEITPPELSDTPPVRALKRDLLEQLYKPVRWVESVQALAANGATQLVECGPGKVLAGLNKRCAEGVSTSNLNTPDAFAAARSALA